MRNVIFFVLLLSVMCTLQAEKIAELKDLSRPEKIVLDKKKLYVLEDANIYVFSLRDYRLLKKFGKKGNGPGELKPVPNWKLNMKLNNDELIVNSMNKIVTFNGDGKVINERRVSFPIVQVLPIGENFAVVKSVFDSRGANSIGLVYFNGSFAEVKTAYRREFPHYSKSGKIDMIPHLVVIRKYKNEIYAFDQVGEFEINVYDPTGEHVRTIKTDYKKRKVPRSYVEKTWEWARKDIRLRKLKKKIRDMAYLPDYFPAMKNFVIDDGKIYVQTYEMKFSKGQSRFIITDLKGKILKKIYLKGADINTIEYSPYTFRKGEYIYLYENPETETIELHKEKIH